MKNFYILSFLTICAFLSFLYGCNPSTGGIYLPSVIKGKVIDSSTHKPLAGVTIKSIPASDGAMTDTSGSYILTNVPMSSSGTGVWVIAEKVQYVTVTKGVWVPAGDTVIQNIAMVPGNGVFAWNDIKVYRYENNQSISSIDLNNFRTYPITYLMRDIDLKDSADVGLRYQFRSSHLDVNYPGYGTFFGNSMGNFRKSDFDTLMMYYGAHEPLDSIDFPNDRTNKFFTPLEENSVYPFYLISRYRANPGIPKIYGLLYLKSAEYEAFSGRFMVTVDVKINRNGQNYFLQNNK